MRFLKAKLIWADPITRAGGFTGITYLALDHDPPMVEIVERTNGACRVIYPGGVDASIDLPADTVLERLGAEVVDGVRPDAPEEG